YFAGLCATMVALMLMRMGQPALLYLVPGTLGTTVALAARRGELPLLWSGASCGRDSEPARCSHASQPYGRAEEDLGVWAKGTQTSDAMTLRPSRAALGPPG
ncbi:unnamed protein product, partial [Prorocentrum cordatum]